mgnify:CR=1 FL=1
MVNWRDSNLLRALCAAVLTVGFFAMIEAILVVADDDWSALYAGDPGHDWRLKADLDLPEVPHIEEGTNFAVQTNANGLRDDPIPAGGPWVLALGCSTTFGWGVDHPDVWTEVLQASLSMPVVNAGIPGHSTEQGMAWGKALMQRGPSVVILGWGLRDAQWTTLPDVQRRPATFPRNTRLYRKLAQSLVGPSKGSVPRVGEERFVQNMADMVAYARDRGIQVLVLDMTGRSETPSHGSALRRLDTPLVVPVVKDEDHFENDSIHLNIQGNRKLAGQLVEPVKALLSQSKPVPQPEQGLPQTP